MPNSKKQIDPVIAKIAICSVIIAACLIYTIVTFTGIFSIVNKTEITSQQLKEKIARVSYLQEIERNDMLINQNFEVMSKMLPDELPDKEIIKIIHPISEKYNVNISQVTVGEVEEKEQYKTAEVQLTLSAEYNKLMMFCDDLVNSDNLTLIDDFRIGADSSVSDEITMELTYSVYMNK